METIGMTRVLGPILLESEPWRFEILGTPGVKGFRI